MKKVISFSILIFGGIVSLNAQQPGATPRTPTPAEQTQRTLRQRQESNRRFEALRSAGEYNRRISNSVRSAALQTINNLYRKPTKEESKLLAAGKDDLKKYAPFLRGADTGLTKLMMDRGCAEYTSVLNVSEECRNYSMPGAGSSFSFRTENYRIWRLADLTYREDGFHSPGILSHSILVSIGDFPLEQITRQTNGLKFLTDFETVSEFEKAREIDKQINDGIENGGFFYSRKAEAVENTTYILRVVAYRGSYFRAVQGFVYDELDFDERRDVTVAFRIVRRDDDESVTILWKILANQKSPVIKKPTRDELKLEENKFMAETDKAEDDN
ncbi:hypothetical protein BH20ACI4_BH20ACI4_22420 [soil metagenome]